jgi:hypothetical protein
MPQAVVVFLAVAASGKNDAVLFTPDFCGIVDKFRAVAAVKLKDGQKGGGFDAGESPESPFAGVVEEGT